MRVFSCFMLITIFELLSLCCGLNAIPVIIQRASTSYFPSGLDQHLNSVSNEQYSKNIPEPTVQQSDLIRHPKLPSNNLMVNPFYLFAAYDKRGPWRLSFLPQPPPTPTK